MPNVRYEAMHVPALSNVRYEAMHVPALSDVRYAPSNMHLPCKVAHLWQ